MNSSIIPDESICPHCKRPMKIRHAAKQPTILNFLFGASFLAFLAASHYKLIYGKGLWIWSAAQLILGMFLMRSRINARKLVFRCTWCESNLRS